MDNPFTADDVISQISEAIIASGDWQPPVYDDPVTGRLLSLADSVAGTPATVLLSGESGVGKEVFARYIHFRSPRKQRPFVAINCAAIAESLLESELFGHEKGAFSGAVKQHRGVFEQANKGTLLLDEISEMPLDLQPKLLRVLQERVVRRVGASKDIDVDIRVIATTNRDLLEFVDEGHFRRDLYYRLSVFPIEIPPLRERKKDIPKLAVHYTRQLSRAFDREIDGLTDEALTRLEEYPFPGNVRELVNVVQRAIILAGDAPKIGVEHLAFETTQEVLDSVRGLAIDEDEDSTVSFKVGETPLTEVRRLVILETLRHYDGNRSRTAEALGVSARTIRNKIKQYRELGIEVPDS